MADTHRIKPVLDVLAAKSESAVRDMPRADKGKAHGFPDHHHEAMTHSHGHSHVIHYRVPGERDEWQHLTTTHEHTHHHDAMTHLHAPHAELGFEHVHEAHHHDHSAGG